MGRGEDKSIFMYSQSDRFPLPVFMMGFWNSVQEQVTLFKQSANKRRSEDVALWEKNVVKY